MDFQNVNSLNARFNLISGNLFPMTNRNSFSFFWKIHGVFTWVIFLTTLILVIPGYIDLLTENNLENKTIEFGNLLDSLTILLHIWYVCTRIHTHKDVMYQIIEKLNEMLHITDEIMKIVVPSTLDQVKTPLNFYWFTTVVSSFIWGCLTFLLAFEKDQFSNEDYGKICVDVYVVHLILIITAQYKYIRLKFATICQEENISNEFGTKNSLQMHRRKEKEIKTLCRHHKNVLYTTSLLKKILSFNFTITYINSIFKFSFIGILLSGVPSSNIFEAIWIIIYAVGVAVQLYILCSSVQQLLDASTEVTDQAFHESWYLLQPSLKRIFLMTIMTNNLDSKISSFDKFNLSLPSFMTILNQAYSITLLFLKMK